MTSPESTQATPTGALWAVGAVMCFSTNDVLIKFLSGDYALHEIVFIRSIIGILCVLAFILPFSGGWASLETRRLGAHVIRGLCVVFANLCFFLGLAALPLAEAVAIFFISPLLISVASVVFLGETVGPRRWTTIALGFLGVLIVLRPGTSAFQIASLLPLAAAFGYAALHTLTRKIGATESGVALAFYVQLVFLIATVIIGLSLGDGRFGDQDHPSLAFLFRAWVQPEMADWPILLAVGATSAFGGYAIGQAYRLSEAAFVAPFEYAAMPMAVLWGFLVFDEFPDTVAILGILLILGSGLYLILREASARRAVRSRPPSHR